MPPSNLPPDRLSTLLDLAEGAVDVAPAPAGSEGPHVRACFARFVELLDAELIAPCEHLTISDPNADPLVWATWAPDVLLCLPCRRAAGIAEPEYCQGCGSEHGGAHLHGTLRQGQVIVDPREGPVAVPALLLVTALCGPCHWIELAHQAGDP